jgi:hypothetical protein
MKLLHVALITPSSPQLGLRAALRSFAGSDRYEELSWIPFWNAGRIVEFRENFLSTVREFQPDLTFFQLQTPDILLPEQLREVPGFKVEWCGDLRNTTPTHYIDRAPHVDVMTFSNMRDVLTLRGMGHRAEFLNIGFSTNVFCPEGPQRPGTPEIIFLGSDYKNVFPQSEERRQMVDMLRSRYGDRFAVYGNGWGKEDNFLSESEEAAAYRTCKVAIQQNHYNDVSRFTSDRVSRKYRG